MREKKMRSKKIGLLPVLCLIALTAGVTYAAVMYIVEVSMTLEIAGFYDLSLYNEDAVTPLTHIDIGILHRGDLDYLGPYYIQNHGDYPTYVSFDLIDWPSDVDVTMDMRNEDGSYDYALTPGMVMPDPIPLGEKWSWTFVYEVDHSAVWDTYTPTLRWNANDSP